MKCRICGKEYDEPSDNYELLDNIMNLGIDYENICDDCLNSGFYEVVTYARKVFKEDL